MMESLDLDESGGGLAGLTTAKDWLANAVKAAIGDAPQPKSGRGAWGGSGRKGESREDAEEKRIMESLARLDVKLERIAADPAAAYVRAAEHVEMKGGGRAGGDDVGEGKAVKPPLRVIQAPALDHWNDHAALEGRGGAMGGMKQLIPVVPSRGGGARDRRIRSAKNK